MGDQRASKSGIPTLYGAIGAVVRKVWCLEMFPGELGHALSHVVLSHGCYACCLTRRRSRQDTRRVPDRARADPPDHFPHCELGGG